MIVSKLTLRNFRNYDHVELEFSPKLNVIVGDNAEGKTNIVEAIYYLSLARSFRTSEINDLIKERRQFATIEAVVDNLTTRKEIVALMTSSSKKVSCNGKQVRRISDLSKLINVIVFEPKDALMFHDSPLVRRNYLDINLSKKSPVYLENLIEFEKLLKERNSILKGEEIDKIHLDVVTKKLIEVEEQIVRYRLAYISEINKILSKIVKAIKGDDDEAILNYNPFIRMDEQFSQACARAYARNLESDIKHKATQIGIHREDFSLSLNGKDIATHGSQGENRLVVIALKLAPYFLIEDEGEKPIVVLDDALSELDYIHRQRLIRFVAKMNQVFITATELNVSNATIFVVNHQNITRRNT